MPGQSFALLIWCFLSFFYLSHCKFLRFSFWLEILHPPLQASVATVQLWVSGILAVLRVLVSQSTEDIVLSRVHELSLSPHLLSCDTIKRLHQQSPSSSDPPTCDTLCNQEPNGEAQKALPEETFARWVCSLSVVSGCFWCKNWGLFLLFCNPYFAFFFLLNFTLSLSPHSRFLLQLVGVLLDDISTRQVKVDITEQQHTFYCQQLGTLLMCLIHVFKSGEHTSFH